MVAATTGASSTPITQSASSTATAPATDSAAAPVAAQPAEDSTHVSNDAQQEAAAASQTGGSNSGNDPNWGTSADQIAGIKANYMNDRVQGNEQVTQSYHNLSDKLNQAEGNGSGSNWATFATWASKSVGDAIRGESLPDWDTSPFRDVTEGNLAEGNLKVYSQVAPAIQTYVDGPGQDSTYDQKSIDNWAQTSGVDPGLVPAFQKYYDAKFETGDAKQQDMNTANLDIGKFEQANLQSNLDSAFVGPLSGRVATEKGYVRLDQPNNTSLNLSKDLPGAPGSGADDWSNYDDRMRYITALFSQKAQESDLFNQPFTADQRWNIENGNRA